MDKEDIPANINVYSYVLANLKRHKLRSFLTIFGLIVCIVFFIVIASLSIGLYEPTEPELPTEPETPEEKFTDPDVIELDQEVKQTIVNWLYATAVLIFATATAGVANTMLISMSERKREIGIFKSLGFTRRQIVEIFFAETFTICLIAFFVGVVVGLYLSNNIFNYLGEDSKDLFFGTLRTPPVVIFAAFIIVFVVGLLAGILPAYRAAKLSPIEALRG